VSVAAISWALNLAPVPADRGGQPSSACKFVLVGLANHAAADRTARARSRRWPRWSATPGCRNARFVPAWDRLAAEGIISPCDPGIVAARIKRADRRPQGWDLDLSLARHDLDDATVAVLEHQFPGLTAGPAPAAPSGADDQANGVHPPRSVLTCSGAVDNRPGGVQQFHPEPGTGRNRHAGGVQLAQERGCSSCTQTVQGTVRRTLRRPRVAGRGARPRRARRRPDR
jgi:hypothetical protein